MTPKPKSNDAELREELAAIEHERWAAWQIWCNRVIRENAADSDKLEAILKRWDRQINLPYQLLSDQEKASDMEQVDRYWPLIEKRIQANQDRLLNELLKEAEDTGYMREMVVPINVIKERLS